jgi:predicted transcriptional regulator
MRTVVAAWTPDAPTAGGSYLAATEPPSLGPLERAVMEVVWAAPPGGMQVQDVVDRLPSDHAYTTVMTLLVRLVRKGLLDRHRRGRAYLYQARVTRSELAALAMARQLEDADDQPDVLLRFVGELGPEQRAALLSILDQDPR